MHAFMYNNTCIAELYCNKLKSSLNGSQIIFWNLHCLFIMNVLIHVSWNIVDVRFIVVSSFEKAIQGGQLRLYY